MLAAGAGGARRWRAEPLCAGDHGQRRRDHPLRHRRSGSGCSRRSAPAATCASSRSQQLTEDRVKVQAADDLGIELPEGAIEAGLEEFATGRGLTIDDVLLALDARGIDRQTMDDFVESGLLWREVIGAALPRPRHADRGRPRRRARASPRNTPQRDADAGRDRAALRRARRARDRRRWPSGSTASSRAAASFAAAAREYSRSATAGAGGVLEPMPAAQLPPAFRTQVLLLSPGQVTRPIPISGGVAMIKLVSIRQVRPEPDRRRRRPGGARGAAPAALHRAHHQLRPGLPPGAARRRPHRRAMTRPGRADPRRPRRHRRRDRAQGLGRAPRAACRSS